MTVCGAEKKGLTGITLAYGKLAMVAIRTDSRSLLPPPGNGVAEIDLDAILSGEMPVNPQVGAGEALDQELGRRFKAAQEARKKIDSDMAKSQRLREGRYSPKAWASLKNSGGSKTFFNITEQKSAAAEANLIDLFLFSASRAWGIAATPIPELPVEAVADIMQKAFAATGAVEGEDYQAAFDELESRMKTAMKADADQRAERMQELIDDQFEEGGWRDSLLDVLCDFCTYEVSGWMGPIPKRLRVRSVVGGRIVVEERIIPVMMSLDPFGIYPAAGSTKVEDGDFFYRTRISDDTALELLSSPNINRARADEAYRRRGAKLGDGDMDALLEEEVQRQATDVETSNPDGMHELVYWWHRMTRAEAAGAMREPVPEGRRPEERAAYMGLMLNGIVISCAENWDPLGRPQIHLCRFRRRSRTVFGKSLPRLNKDAQNMRNVATRSLHTNMLYSQKPMMEAKADRLVNPWETTMLHPGQVFLTKEAAVPDGRPAMTPIAIPNFTAQMLSAANQAGAWSDDATGIYPQAYGDARQIGPAETMGGYKMLREDQVKVLKLAIISLDEAVRSLVSAFWLWNMLSQGNEDCKGDSKVVARGAVQLFLNNETANAVAAMLAHFLDHPDQAAAYLKANGVGLIRMYREWFTLTNLDPDRFLKTEEEAEEEVRAAQEQAEAEAAAAEEEARRQAEANATPQGTTAPPPETESDRMKAQADMIRAQAAQKKADIEEGKLAIARADATVRAMKAQREARAARVQVPEPPPADGEGA